jgi:hypothetical protein
VRRYNATHKIDSAPCWGLYFNRRRSDIGARGSRGGGCTKQFRSVDHQSVSESRSCESVALPECRDLREALYGLPI